MNAVIYARYSSDNQREESIDGQIRECKEYAMRKGLTVIECYIDRARSARTDQRPEFQRMIEDSARKRFEIVLVWKFDRFARNKFDSVYYKKQLRKNGVNVVSAVEPIPDGPEGILLESLLEGVDEYYSVELAVKVRRGLTENALKCKYNGGTVPFGYYVDENQYFQIDPATAPLVQEIYQRYAEGESIRSIQESMNERGVTTQRGRAFTPNSFNVILHNRRYLGEYRYGEVVQPGGMPQIISEGLFEQVRQRLERNKRAPASAKAAEPYLLTGKLFCGLCGRQMAGENGRSHTGTRHYYYKCSAAKRKQGCTKKAVRKHLIEDLVVQQAERILQNDKLIERIADMMVEELGAESVLLPKLRAQLVDTRKRLDNLLKAVEAGIFNDTTQTRMAELEQQRTQLETEIAKEELAKPQISQEDIIAWLCRFRDLDIQKESHRRILIDSFINSVYVYDDKIVLTFNYREGTETISLAQVQGSNLNCGSPPEDKSEPDADWRQVRIFLYGGPSLRRFRRRMKKGLSQNDLRKTIEAALLLATKLKTNRLKTPKNSAQNLRGIVYLSKMCAVFLMDTLSYTLCKKVGSRPACLNFMMQLQNIIRHAYKVPFCLHIGVSSG